jgi:hypothetical protein
VLTHGAPGAAGQSSGGTASAGAQGVGGACLGSCATGAGGSGGGGSRAGAPALSFAGVGVLSGTSITIAVSCDRPPCTGTIALQPVKASARPIAIAVAAGTGRARLGGGAFAIRRKGTVKLRLALTPRSRRLLRKNGSLAARAVVLRRHGPRKVKAASFLRLLSKPPIPPRARVRPAFVARGRIVVPVRCGGAACHGTVELLLRSGSGAPRMLASGRIAFGKESGGSVDIALPPAPPAAAGRHASVIVRVVVRAGAGKPHTIDEPLVLAAHAPATARPSSNRPSRAPAHPPYPARRAR